MQQLLAGPAHRMQAGAAMIALALGACAPAPGGPSPAPAAGDRHGERLSIERPLSTAPGSGPGWGIVIHGGAGTMERGSITPETERQYHATLEEALRAGLRAV